ncbi:MAG: hypothetical protein BJ554DRAFT_2518 [Olpidium bornovanus]|uniref:Uncharacterized protein n=1 Tax=Olpidium bornovanus TaxID=278681 RepID=A0A8H8DG84_9FUNG|nr:MAG: hypothetical protein BJ554DRAFT_2518 [Olpidium bornovanus]
MLPAHSQSEARSSCRRLIWIWLYKRCHNDYVPQQGPPAWTKCAHWLPTPSWAQGLDLRLWLHQVRPQRGDAPSVARQTPRRPPASHRRKPRDSPFTPCVGKPWPLSDMTFTSEDVNHLICSLCATKAALLGRHAQSWMRWRRHLLENFRLEEYAKSQYPRQSAAVHAAMSSRERGRSRGCPSRLVRWQTRLLLTGRLLGPPGFEHSLFVFQTESRVDRAATSRVDGEVKRGALIRTLQKGLQFLIMEAHLNEVAAVCDACCNPEETAAVLPSAPPLAIA